ncbi:hypothetical protein HF324_05775 [Chitinophaga oryzae]|uniref:Uncharacterized protein n=1 Tax=Chitinophaga oryzae TaxID=2725414 RepID=A0AAE6ZF36_9BACT|nr:hypothetical protein [Chitinophaga oryzae]QJB30895.1 hypothetical protein HF329_06105 [Chitinophaga oryzae]QJB37385.1 hypothetical protein HF324_05775 [Chitinophaga oryzae]
MLRDTVDVLKENERKFNRSRRMLKAVLVLLLSLMALLQFNHITALLKSIF